MSRFRFKPIIWDDIGNVGSPYSPNVYENHFKKDDPALPRVNELFQDSNGNTFIHKIDEKGRHRYIDVGYNPSKKDKLFGRFYKQIDMTDASEYGPICAFWRIEGDIDIICTRDRLAVFDISNDESTTYFDSLITVPLRYYFTEPSMVRAVRLLNGVIVVGISSAVQKKTVFFKIYQYFSDRPSLDYEEIFHADFSACPIVDEEKAVFALLYHGQQYTGNTYKVRAVAFAPNGINNVSYVMSSQNYNQDYEIGSEVLPENIPFLIEGDYKTGEGSGTLLFATSVKTEGALTAYGMKCVNISANIPSDFSQTTFSISASTIRDTTQELIVDLTRVECYYPDNAAAANLDQSLVASSINGKGNFAILGNDGAWIIRSVGNGYEATKHLFSSEEKVFLSQKQVFGIARAKSESRYTNDRDPLDNLYLPAAHYTNSVASYAETGVVVLSVNQQTAALSLLNDESHSLNGGCDFPGSHDFVLSCNGLQTMIVTQNYRSNTIHTIDLASLDSDLGRAAKVHVLDAVFGIFRKIKAATIDAAIGYFEGIISKTADIEEADIKKQVSEEIETEVLHTKEIGVDNYIVNSDKIEGFDRSSQTTSATSLIAYETIEEESSKVLSTDNLVFTLLSVRVGGLNTHKTRLEIFAYKDDPTNNVTMIGDDSPKVLKNNIDDTTFEKYAVGRAFVTDDPYGGSEDTSLVYIPRVFSTSVATPIVIDVYRVGFDTTPSLARTITLNRYGEYQDYSEKINNIAFHYQDNQIWVIGYVGLRGNVHEYVLFKYDVLGNLISATAMTGVLSGYTTLQASKIGLIRKYGSTIFCIYMTSGNYSFVTLRFEEGHRQGTNDKEFYEGIGFTGINTSYATKAMQKDRGFTAISNTAVLVDSDLTDTGTFAVLNWRRTYMSNTTEVINLNGKVYGYFVEKEEMDDPRIIAYNRSFDSSNYCDFRVWDGFSDEKSALYSNTEHVVRKQYSLFCNPYVVTNLSNYLSLVSVRKNKLVFAIVHGQWATTDPGSQYCITMAKLPINITCASFDQIFGSYGNFVKAQVGSLLGEKGRFQRVDSESMYPEEITLNRVQYNNYLYSKNQGHDDVYGVDTPASSFKIVTWSNGNHASSQFNLCTSSANYGEAGSRVIVKNERTDTTCLEVGYQVVSGDLKKLNIAPGASCEFVKVDSYCWVCAGATGAGPEAFYSSFVSNSATVSQIGVSWVKGFQFATPLLPGGHYDLTFVIYTRGSTSQTGVPTLSTSFSLLIGGNNAIVNGTINQNQVVMLGGLKPNTSWNNSAQSKYPVHGSGANAMVCRYSFVVPLSIDSETQFLWIRQDGPSTQLSYTLEYTGSAVHGIRY